MQEERAANERLVSAKVKRVAAGWPVKRTTRLFATCDCDRMD
jgi:hypothetical protein